MGSIKTANGRRIAVFEASDDEAGAVASLLARESVEFTFEPMPDGFWRVTVKADQWRSLDVALAAGVNIDA
jgi:hypothetical protein